MSQLREDPGPLRRRAAILLATLLAVFLLLALRLAHLQLINSEYWHAAAENNRVRRIPIASERGRIFDRRGTLVSENQPAWQLLLFPDEARVLERTVLFLARTGVHSAAELTERVRSRRGGPMAPILLAESLTWSQVAAIRAHQAEYPELSVISGWRRNYPFGALTSHVVGHLRLASQEDLDRNPSWMPDTHVGASGIEALFESTLNGEQGERWIVTNAIGRQLGMVLQRKASAGSDLTVTLDVNLQRVAAEQLGDNSGAVVALEPSSGAIRVLYSSPAFDPNDFVGGLSRSDWQRLREDPEHPLQNRCVQGVYPPASTIKPILLLGALTNGTISPSWRTYCRGSITLFNHPFRCWWRGGHGNVDLERSLEVSCDVYYYQLGQKMGIESIADWLANFGFGQETGLGFAGEHPGLVGTPDWSTQVLGTPWYAGEVVSVSIGQGPVLTTVLQMARAYAGLANRGSLVQPFLVETADRVPPRKINLKEGHISRVIKGLEDVVHGHDGTARSLSTLPIAGKTGTAQVVRLQENVQPEDMEKRFRHHAWFVGWAPLDEPSLVVAVLVEHGGGGGPVAAPIAGEILKAHLENRLGDTI